MWICACTWATTNTIAKIMEDERKEAKKKEKKYCYEDNIIDLNDIVKFGFLFSFSTRYVCELHSSINSVCYMICYCCITQSTSRQDLRPPHLSAVIHNKLWSFDMRKTLAVKLNALSVWRAPSMVIWIKVDAKVKKRRKNKTSANRNSRGLN